MKKTSIIYLVSAFFLFQACDSKKEKQPNEVEISEEKPTEDINQYSQETFNSWLNYYNNQINGFDLTNFEKEKPFKIIRSKSNVTPVWDKNFNANYKNYLVYSPDSTKYIDFDSYKWKFDKKKGLEIGPDQEIVLVNIPEKKVESILFYGPSYWVENAYFKNDSVVVLLENSSDGRPGYQEINLNKDSSQYYIYPKKVKNPEEYLKNRILSIQNKDL
ncbi:hypothetical protein KRX57_10530 [Weeksellaceae bacterium TAE3-ERU29]|nr:hypothetical protein [Weeksellaceae bacterium TAE3-ERU29]